MSKKQFWGKFAVWVVLAVVIPIVAIAWRYDLFGKSKLRFTGWGIIALLVLFIFLMVLLGYFLKLLKWSMPKQVLSGIRNISVPLLFIFFGCGLIANNIENIKVILLITLVSETIAIPFNPFPQWLYLKNREEIVSSVKEANSK